MKLIIVFLLFSGSLLAQDEVIIDTTFNGKNIESITYKLNGQQTRRLEYLFASGTLYSDIIFKNGKKHGKSLYYFKNGNLRSVSTFDNGELSGVTSSHYENGQKKFEYTVSNGRSNGDIVYYTDKGELFEGDYVDFDANGQ